MSVGLVPLPVPPVKAPSPNFCPAPSKPFACHTSEKSLKLSTPSQAATTNRKIVPGRSNSFTHISFADPHPLNSVVSYRYKNRGGGANCPTLHSLPAGTPISRSALWFANPPIFHSLPTFRIRRRIPPTRSLPPKNLALLY